jgi:sugar lactone lactonase YvrE
MTIKFTLILSSIFICLNNTFAQTSYTINTIAGTGTTGYFGDGGQAVLAQFDTPYTTCVDTLGNVYIADPGNNRIRKVSTSGLITTVAGNGTSGFSGDGGNATLAQLNYPSNICIDRTGNLYVIDGGTRVRKISTSNIITTIAGNGTSGFSGDGGSALLAQFNFANGIAIDTSHNIYITDYGNNRIRKVTATGTITTIAGNGTSGYSGDGGLATNAEIAWVAGIAVDFAGNVFITDNLNNVVRKIANNNIISTVAGNGTSGFSGDNSLAVTAQLNSPYALAIDASNNLYISDNVNNRIRVVSTNSIITTIAGNGSQSFTGDGSLATSASLNGPNGITVNKFGTIYFVDQGNSRVRSLTPNLTTGIKQVWYNNNNQVNVFPNPSSNNFIIQTNNIEKQTVLLFDINSKLILNQTFSEKINIDASNLNDGVYTLTIKNINSVTTTKVVIVH